MGALVGFLRSLPQLVLRARLALLLHLFQLLLAMCVLFPLSRAFEATFGQSVVGEETGAGRFVEFAWQDLHLAHGDLLAQASQSFSAIALAGLFLSFTLLSAGTFALLATPGSGSSVREFLAGAGRLFARFVRLFLLFAPCVVALAFVNRGLTLAVNFAATDGLGRAASSRVVGWLLHAKTIWMLLLLGWLVAATALAKSRAALHDEKSMVRAFFGGWKSALSRPFSSALLAAIGPLMLAGCVGAWAFLRDPLAASNETTIGSFVVPTWAVLLVIGQAVGWLEQATTIVWTESFLEFERGRAARTTAGAASRTATIAASWLVVGLALPGAHAAAANEWNNAYRITATLDPGAKTVVGEEHVTFTNRGTKPVSELRLHLYANAFAHAETTFLRERRVRTGRDPLAGLAADALGGVTIQRLLVGSAPVEPIVDETVMRVPLAAPLAAGASVELTIAWVTKLASIDLAGRGGFLGDHFDVMQWFPKLGVLRDGQFDCEPFHCDTEFFADFGSYDVTLVTPRRFVVGATGSLVSGPEPVKNGVPGAADLVARRYVANDVHDFAWCADPNFETHDDTFEAGDHTVAIHYLCQPYAREKAQNVLATAKHCLHHYGQWFAPYPYATLTIDGLPMGAGGGMEYPTLFTISQGFPNHCPWLVEQTEEPVGVTAHEFGHQYWYGLLASDEFHEAWLDEGVNTYVTTKIEQAFFQAYDAAHDLTRTGRAQQSAEWKEVVQPFLNQGLSVEWFGQQLGVVPLIGFEASPFTVFRRGNRSDPTLLGFALPIGITPGFGEMRGLGRRDSFVPNAGTNALSDVSFDLEPNAYAAITYSKTALALGTLEAVFGWDALRAALKEYVLRYRFKHPRGEEFLNVLRDVLPRETAEKELALEPFLHEMWQTSDVLDLAVAEARSTPARAAPGAPAEWRTQVLVENRGTMKLPAKIQLHFKEGRDEWKAWPADRRFLVIDEITASQLDYAEVDPAHTLLLDVDWSNNGRTVARNDAVVRRFDSAALFWIESAFSFLRTLAGP